MSALMLTACNFRQSQIPADWVGSWFSADGGWQCSLYEQVALYNNNVWHYQSVAETDSSLNVTIANGGRTVSLDFTGFPGTESHSENGALISIEKIPFLFAKYSVDGEFMGFVLKNNAVVAAELCRKFDSVAGITPPQRVAEPNPVPDGNIGSAVVRLYLRNNLRGPESITDFPKYLTDGYYISYSNRLEEGDRKMQLVESDQFGRMFEAVIPVDGMANFGFSPSEDLGQSILRSYLAAQGDTVMVVVNWQDRYYNIGSYSNSLSGFYLYNFNSEPFGWMTASITNYFGDDADEEQVISQASQALRVINDKYNTAMRAAPAYSRYYANARNNWRHNLENQMFGYIDKKQCEGKQVSARLMKFMADSFPTADSCVLQSVVAFGNAKAFIPKPFLALTDSIIDMGILYIDENEARRRGYSQLAIDLFQTSIIAKWLNDNAIRFEKFEVYNEKIEDFIAGIKTPGYRNYLEDKYKWFCSCRGYITSVFNGQKLTDSELEAFAQLTNERNAINLRELQDNLSYYDYALPRVEITVTSHKPGTYYLYDSEYPNVAIDSLYSSRGFYVFHNKLEVGHNYTLKCNGKEKCDFTVVGELSNHQFSFSD